MSTPVLKPPPCRMTDGSCCRLRDTERHHEVSDGYSCARCTSVVGRPQPRWQEAQADMTRWDAETAVVGLGRWGAAALWRQASRGGDVIGFGRYTPAHVHGASPGGSRMIRLARPEHPGLVPPARRSTELWQEPADTGREYRAGRESLFVASGGLVIGPENGRLTVGTLRAARTWCPGPYGHFLRAALQLPTPHRDTPPSPGG